MRHPNDAISIESWINEAAESETVLFYKAQNKPCDQYHLKDEDFILIIMHPGQLEMLMKFKDDCICIDGTHGLNPYQFELTTLLIVDDMREGFPCCFMFLNTSSEEIMIISFEEIDKKLNKPMQPNIFMSDMAEYYFTAWVKVMSPPKLRYEYSIFIISFSSLLLFLLL
nr:unnamed protein product [Callosobruchus analis]